jgi:hypothetical protein
MPNPIVTSPKNSEVRVTTTPKTTLQVKTSGTVVSGANKLALMTDVDVTDANDGEVLVYDVVTNKYVIKAIPEIDGGEF